MAAAAVLVAGCSGRTTGATQITQQSDGSYSARLNAIGSCQQNCTAYVRWRVVGTSTWTNASSFNVGPVSNVPWYQTVGGLAAGASYEYQACGKEPSYSQFVCVGPNGSTNTTQKFVAATGSTDWPQFRYQPDHLGVDPFEITITSANVPSLRAAWNASVP